MFALGFGVGVGVTLVAVLICAVFVRMGQMSREEEAGVSAACKAWRRKESVAATEADDDKWGPLQPWCWSAWGYNPPPPGPRPAPRGVRPESPLHGKSLWKGP